MVDNYGTLAAHKYHTINLRYWLGEKFCGLAQIFSRKAAQDGVRIGIQGLAAGAGSGVVTGNIANYSVSSPFNGTETASLNNDLLALPEAANGGAVGYTNGKAPLDWMKFNDSERISLIANYLHNVNSSDADYWQLTDLFYNIKGVESGSMNQGIFLEGSIKYKGNITKMQISLTSDAISGGKINRGFAQQYTPPGTTWLYLESSIYVGKYQKYSFMMMGTYIDYSSKGFDDLIRYLGGR